MLEFITIALLSIFIGVVFCIAYDIFRKSYASHHSERYRPMVNEREAVDKSLYPSHVPFLVRQRDKRHGRHIAKKLRFKAGNMNIYDVIKLLCKAYDVKIIDKLPPDYETSTKDRVFFAYNGPDVIFVDGYHKNKIGHDANVALILLARCILNMGPVFGRMLDIPWQNNYEKRRLAYFLYGLCFKGYSTWCEEMDCGPYLHDAGYNDFVHAIAYNPGCTYVR